MPDSYLSDDLKSLGVKTHTLSNIGTRIFGGRMQYPYALATGGAANGRTWAVRTVAAAPNFLAVRMILAASQSNTADCITPTVLACVAPLPDKSDASIAAATYQTLTFGGAGSTTLPPGSAYLRRNFVMSDWLPMASVPRSDGGAYPMLDMQVTLYTTGTAGNVMMFNNPTASDSILNWATRPDGRIWDVRQKGGGFASPVNAGGMTASATVAANFCPIIGFQYLTESGVITIGAFGDSITDGRGTYLQESFVLPALVELQAATGIAYEFANLGWSGITTTNIKNNIIDAMAAGISMDAAFVPNYSPNDTGFTTYNDSVIATARLMLGQNLLNLRAKNITPIVWTGIATNTSVGAFGASDTKRRAANDITRMAAQHGAIIADMDAVMAGVADGSGQVQMKAGTTSDNIHPNDVGYGLMKTVAKASIARVASPVSGLLS